MVALLTYSKTFGVDVSTVLHFFLVALGFCVPWLKCFDNFYKKEELPVYDSRGDQQRREEAAAAEVAMRKAERDAKQQEQQQQQQQQQLFLHQQREQEQQEQEREQKRRWQRQRLEKKKQLIAQVGIELIPILLSKFLSLPAHI